MKPPFIATTAEVFHIGGNDASGHYTTPLTDRLPPEEFRKVVADILDLVPIEEKTDITFVIDPVRLLKVFTDNIINEIEKVNNNLFNRLMGLPNNSI